MSQRPLIEVEEVSKTYTVKAFAYHYTVEALRQVSFSVKEGEVLGIVGESGSGKSTLAKILVRIVSPDAGSVVYADTITQFQRQVQMIFQNPYTSLNPLMNVRSALAEVIAVHRLCARREMPDRIQKALAQVELPPDIQARQPSELSGGQRQRVAIARSLLLEPRVLVCDEIVSGLDYPTGYTIIRLLLRLRAQQRMTILFITHNIQLLSMLATRIAVFYKGYLVEIGPADEVIRNPLHPYTVELIKAASYATLGQASVRPQSPAIGSNGCPYASRCDYVHERCRNPAALYQAEKGHWVRCYQKDR